MATAATGLEALKLNVPAKSKGAFDFEVLVTSAVDLSGRAYCVWQATIPTEMLGAFNAALAEEFWRAVASHGALNLHVLCHYGRNAHHIVEGIFKAAARALRQAVEADPRVTGVPSTKGVL